MAYGLWLLTDDGGRIILHGWSDPDTEAPINRTDHWPIYTLCQDRTQLSERLDKLGLTLAPGADLGDLDKGWDVYVRHPDLGFLRARLDRDSTEHRDRP